jgi:hypothetical protein
MKSLDLPLKVARAFVRDMKAFHAEKDPIKADAIAANQMAALRQYQGPREKSVRLTEVKRMFAEMKDQV